jgi:hypothetical protein
MHTYEIRPRKDKRGFDLISDALPFGRLWYTEIPHAIGYAEFYSRSHDAVIRVYDDGRNVIKVHWHKALQTRKIVSSPYSFGSVLQFFGILKIVENF